MCLKTATTYVTKNLTTASHYQELPVLVMVTNAQPVRTHLKILEYVNTISDECNGAGQCVHNHRDGAPVSPTPNSISVKLTHHQCNDSVACTTNDVCNGDTCVGTWTCPCMVDAGLYSTSFQIYLFSQFICTKCVYFMSIYYNVIYSKIFYC
jgi:hypothetical protein